jgi:propanol-preferring alcohol dehydrogenase
MSLLSWIDYNKKEGSNSKQRSTMNAVRYYGPNKPLGFDVVDKPSAETLGDDEIIVQVKAAALCHTELHFADGTLDLGVKPMTLGHETAGVIVATGSKVPKTRLNERVILYYYVGCGRVGDDNSKSTPSPSECCRWCQQGQEQICPNLKAEYGFISDGGLAEFVKLPARNAVPLPESISFEDAAPIGCGLTTAVHAAKMARMSITSDFKETALVYGE